MAVQLSARAAALTDVGRRRRANEDWCGCLEPRDDDERRRDGWLWVVADGVGAYGTGEEASRSAGEAILEAYRRGHSHEPQARVQVAVEAGNRAVWERRREYVRRGQSRPVMSTVLAAAVVDDRAYLANVGDCRAYLIRDGIIRQLTQDHTWVGEQVAAGQLDPEQAREHPRRHMVTRSLGQYETVQVDLHEQALEPADRLVLCSDGLTEHLRDSEILQIATSAPAQVATRRLIDVANARGGEDNITAAVIELLPASPPPPAGKPVEPIASPASVPPPPASVAAPAQAPRLDLAPASSPPAEPPPAAPPANPTERRNYLAVLKAIGERFSASLDLAETLDSVIDTIVEVTGGERGFIMLLDEATGELAYSAGRNVEPGTETPTFSRNIVQTVFETGRPMQTGDALADPNLSQYESVVIQNLRSIVCAPLEVKGNRIGVVYVEHRADADVFAEADLELLCAFAGQAAIALENARLYEQLRKQVAENAVMRTRQENVLRSINSAIVALDTDGRVLICNPPAEELLGIRAEQALGRQLTELLPAGLVRALRALVAEQDGETEAAPEAVELTVNLPHRGRIVLSVRALPLADTNDRRAGSLLIAHDLTEQRELELARQREANQKERVKAVFGRYLAPFVIDQLMDDPSSVQLGGVRRDVTIMFSDIRGFTGISERNPPEEVVAILNSYLACATEVILSVGGTLDKFLGDGVMAFFNAPLEQEQHALAAVRAALMMQSRLRDLRGAADGRIAFGIGINTGEGVVGNIGTADLMNYTVIGDVVNVAARLQGEARAGEVLISSTTYEQVAEQVEVEELGAIHVKGRSQPVQIYKVVRVLD